MKLARVVTKIISFIFFLFRYRSVRFAYLLANNNISFNRCSSIIRKKNNLLSISTGNTLPVSTAISFGIGIINLLDAIKYPELKIESSDKSSFIAKFDDLKINVSSVTNIYTLYEIFVKKMYDISLQEEDVIILDIGMNVGYASLFFAANSKVSKIYAFEPFPETFAEAIKNLTLNPQLNNKIIPFNYGISDSTKEVDVPLLGSGSAIASTNDLFITKNNLENSKKIQVKVKDIAAVVEEIVQQKLDKPIYLKIDCEGEEYAIVEKLHTSGYLKNISGILLEWHIKGPKILIDTLTKNQFTVLSVPIINATAVQETEAGMLYAFKN
jgi:FkbM family methyltransferase